MGILYEAYLLAHMDLLDIQMARFKADRIIRANPNNGAWTLLMCIYVEFALDLVEYQNKYI